MGEQALADREAALKALEEGSSSAKARATGAAAASSSGGAKKVSGVGG